jgi:nucleoside-diphosphate-sugar epimerase
MIGFRVLVELLESGYQVRAAVRKVDGFERIKALKRAAPYASQLTHIIVPDITVPGAYDEAVKGVKYVIHLASPLEANLPDEIDYETQLIQPAIKGTMGMLESAQKDSGVSRIVITGSILSIISLFDNQSGEILDGESPRHIYLHSADMAIPPRRDSQVCSD